MEKELEPDYRKLIKIIALVIPLVGFKDKIKKIRLDKTISFHFRINF